MDEFIDDEKVHTSPRQLSQRARRRNLSTTRQLARSMSAHLQDTLTDLAEDIMELRWIDFVS
eukprot:1490869-Prymnesium_polylepis.3